MTYYRIIQKRKYFLSITGSLAILSLIAFFTFGLRLGIDFTGGSRVELKFPNGVPTAEKISGVLDPLNLGEIKMQTAPDNTMVFKLKTLTNDERQSILDALDPIADGKVEEVSFNAIGPSIGAELRQKAYVAIVMVLAAIIIYISWAFRRVSQGPVPSWVYGTGAVIALIHDVLIVVGLFVLFGRFLSVEVDSLFVTAILTILGFSVHDTIVVFDRIREGIRKYSSLPFEEIVNRSINETLARSINTSLTALLVLVSLAVFGGASIRMFVIALIAGIIVGTYSSIYIASPVVMIYYGWKQKRFSR